MRHTPSPGATRRGNKNAPGLRRTAPLSVAYEVSCRVRAERLLPPRLSEYTPDVGSPVPRNREDSALFGYAVNLPSPVQGINGFRIKNQFNPSRAMKAT